MRTRVKMCCISSPDEVRDAVAAGTDVLGFVSDTLGGLGALPVPVIETLIPHVPAGVGIWLLTGATDLDLLVRQLEAVGPDTVQLVRPVDSATRAALRARFPGLRRVQVVHVLGEDALQEAVALEEVEAVLLDSSDPAAGALGATGRTHDWALSARIVAACPVPVWLAGGLHAGNVAEAIATVRPFGVDLCSGLRTDGVLDLTRATDFVRATLS